MAVLGSAVPVSALLVDYPLSAGQALRYVVAGVLLTALARLRSTTGWRGVLPAQARPSDVGRLLAVAAVGMVGFNVCLIEACRRASPSLVGSMVGTSPLVLALAAPLLRGRRPGLRAVTAGAVVAAGVVAVEGFGAGDPLGLLFAAGAMLGDVSFSLVALPLLGRWGPLRTAAAACWAAAAELVALAAVTGQPLVARPTLPEALALAHLAVLMTALAFVLWYSGLERLGAARAGLFVGVVPLTAAAVSVLSGAEPLTLHVTLGTLTVGTGLLLGLRTAPR
jgi:drug/metabolite transporter (DMT)-like permease